MNDNLNNLKIDIVMTIIIFSIMIKLSHAAKSRSETEIQCIQENTYWDSIISKEEFIKDSSRCHKVADDCCYINIKYTYNIVPFENSYCFTMTGEPNSWIKKFTNLFSDELKWYANFTYNNYEIYESIGNNLDYVYYANYTCATPVPYQDYSTYNYTNCAIFKNDGSCSIENDAENFEIFVKNLYKNITDGRCSGYTSDGSCINYNKSDYEGLDSSKINSLLENLKISLNIDGVVKEKTNSEEILDTVNLTKWKFPCLPVPLVTVSIKCPDSYSISTFFKLNYFILSFVLIFLFYIDIFISKYI